MLTRVSLTGQTQTTARLATFAGQEYLVVPVIALLGDVVLAGRHSDGPEFIPARVLAQAPGGWNGRPVVAFHPDGSANTPDALSAYQYGYIFNTEFSDNRLRMEAWLSPSRAQYAGKDAEDVIVRCQAGEMVEVSIGAWADIERIEGTAPNGERYVGIWRAVVPDHLAVGLQTQGGVGACSIDMGCGAMRINSAAITTQKEVSRVNVVQIMTAIANGGDNLRETVVGLLANPSGVSDVELRDKISRALRASAPGFWEVVEVFPDSSTVVYVAMPKDSVNWYTASYTLDGEDVKLSRTKQVEPVTKYEVVKNATATSDTSGTSSASADETDTETATLVAACKCQHEKVITDTPDSDPATGLTRNPSVITTTGDLKGDTMSKTALAGQLIALAGAPYEEADRAALEAQTEEQLSALLVAFSKAAPVQLTPQQAFDALPETTRRLILRAQAAEKTHYDGVIAKLVTAQTAFTAAELGAKTIEELEKLLSIVDPNAFAAPASTSFSYLGAPVPRESANEQRDFTPPDPWNINNKRATA